MAEEKKINEPEVQVRYSDEELQEFKQIILDMLAKAKINADRDNRERWEREGRIAPKKKHDMEL